MHNKIEYSWSKADRRQKKCYSGFPVHNEFRSVEGHKLKMHSHITDMQISSCSLHFMSLDFPEGKECIVQNWSYTCMRYSKKARIYLKLEDF